MTSDISDSYLTLAGPATHEIKIKGSRFIGLGFPAADEAEALEILDRIRKQEHAATHHCFAYTVGLEQAAFKYSDDGEPNGTAGRPIYQAVTGRDLANVMAIVVRYYGGTKLGTGGLTRAYSQATVEMLDRAEIVERLICDRVAFTVPFPVFDRLMRLVTAGHYRIIAQDFAEEVSMALEIRKSQTERFISQLTELTGGKVRIDEHD